MRYYYSVITARVCGALGPFGLTCAELRAVKLYRKTPKGGVEEKLLQRLQLPLQAASAAFSLASVPLINSWLSSVTNVSLPSSSPGEEGGVFNLQFVLWIDVCWHRLSPPARTHARTVRSRPPAPCAPAEPPPKQPLLRGSPRRSSSGTGSLRD